MKPASAMMESTTMETDLRIVTILGAAFGSSVSMTQPVVVTPQVAMEPELVARPRAAEPRVEHRVAAHPRELEATSEKGMRPENAMTAWTTTVTVPQIATIPAVQVG